MYSITIILKLDISPLHSIKQGGNLKSCTKSSAINYAWLPLVFRLKKKSQSIDISAAGYDPLGPATQQVLQTAKPTPITKLTTLEEEKNNTTNAQRRNPRRNELKRYYTIGECRTILSHRLHGSEALAVQKAIRY